MEKGKWGTVEIMRRIRGNGWVENPAFLYCGNTRQLHRVGGKSSDEAWLISESGCLIGQSRCLGPM